MTDTATTVQCSGCMEWVTLDEQAGTVTMTVASNGRRGSLHVPAHDVTAEIYYVNGNSLVAWDCPVCGYADSYESTY